MFDQWKPALDFEDGSLTNHHHSQVGQTVAEQFSMESLLDYNPMMLSSLLLLPMPFLKPQHVDSIPSQTNRNPLQESLGDSAFTSDLAFHPPFHQSIHPLEPRECSPYSPASSPNGSCSGLFRAPGSQFIFSSPSNPDHPEAVSDVGFGTPGPSSQAEILPDNCSEASNQCFLNRPQAAGMWDQTATSSTVPNFCGLTQSTALPYNPTETFPATSTGGLSDLPVSLMADVFPLESSHCAHNQQSFEVFSRPWSSDYGNSQHTTFNLNVPQPSALHSSSDTSNKPNNSCENVPAVKLKRYSCPECGQRFARAFNLQTHIATHAGMRPFSCPADGCSKAFSRRHDLGRHVGAVHREWLTLENLTVDEAVKPLRWKTGSIHKTQHHNASSNKVKKEK
ncbi:hypothetical protein PtB15_11B339 [Puccinia triticina]|nr:hypothetical protein PtB15_11B339 [Puccinia triticina]